MNFCYLANKVCFCLLNNRGEFDSLVDALGVHLEGAQGDAGFAAHSVRAPVKKKKIKVLIVLFCFAFSVLFCYVLFVLLLCFISLAPCGFV